MKFTIEIYEEEIARIAILLGRPLLIEPVAKQPKAEKPEKFKTKRKSAKPILRLLSNDGPTNRILAFASKRAEPFTSSQVRAEIGEQVNKDSFYSTLDRLVRQNILALHQQEGERKHYSLTDVGRNMVQRLDA